MSVFVIWETLDHFVHPFTANEKYSLPNSANLQQPVQRLLQLSNLQLQLSKKQISSS